MHEMCLVNLSLYLFLYKKNDLSNAQVVNRLKMKFRISDYAMRQQFYLRHLWLVSGSYASSSLWIW